MSVCNWNRVHCGRLRAALDRRRLEVGGRNASSLSCREGSAEYEADLLSTIRSLGCPSGEDEEEEEEVYCQDKWQEYDLAQEEEPAPANGDGLKWLRNQSIKNKHCLLLFHRLGSSRRPWNWAVGIPQKRIFF